MNRRYIILLVVLIGIGFVLGRISTEFSKEQIGHIPPLKIIGDVVEPITLWSFENDLEKTTIDKGDRTINGVKLKDLIQLSNPIAKDNDILLIGIDGMSSKIKGINLEESYISFTKENGWEAINHNHPMSSNVKLLKEIVIISNEERLDLGLNIIDKKQNILNITPGEALANTNTLLSYFEGESTVKKGDNIYGVEVFTQRKVLELSKILPDRNFLGAIVMGEEGGYKEIIDKGYLEIQDNYINYIGEDGKSSVEKVKGIILDPPKESIMDGYYHMADYLENNEDILFIYIDGLGYHQYTYALENNYMPFLRKKPLGKKATSVYRPVTNAGFAAMITGKPPIENGVYSRAQRELKVDSIFKLVKDLNKSGILIEGDIGILDTEIDPVLNLDENLNGTTDDEVFQSTMDAIDKGYNLIFTHFHGVDDSGHSHGDLTEETMEVILQNDKYIEELTSKWKGKIIITSDHGMHKTEYGGNHGEFRFEDIIVPYISFSGGIADE